jgi:hypothetical protein
LRSDTKSATQLASLQAQHKRELKEASDAFSKLERQYKLADDKLSEYQVKKRPQHFLIKKSHIRELRGTVEVKDKEIQSFQRKVHER